MKSYVRIAAPLSKLLVLNRTTTRVIAIKLVMSLLILA